MSTLFLDKSLLRGLPCYQFFLTNCWITIHYFLPYIYIYIYIYIYCHPQTDCFVLSELFSVARQGGSSKPGSKPIQLYVRLSLRPLGQQAYHVWLRELLRYLCSNSSSRLFTFLYLIGYQSAQFFRRALHYASGGRKFLHQSAQYIICININYKVNKIISLC